MSDLLKVKVGGSSYLCKWEPSFVVIGGRKYKIVEIGNQIWTAENLDYKFDGCTIGSSSSPGTPAAWYYNNDESTYGENGNKYGLLYNWHAVKYLNDNLLMNGWHVATTTEWDALANAVGGTNVAGTKLKSSTGWSSGNGTDDFGFAAFPAGFRFSGSFYDLSNSAYFWTATQSSGTNANGRYFTVAAAMRSNTNSKTNYAFSVRLVKDAT